MNVRTCRILILLAVSVAVLAAPARARAATTVALWHMDESSGQMIDSSSSGNDGTLSNVTRVSPGYNGGGRAYSFNGSNSKVTVPNDSSLNPGSQTVTLKAHVKFSSRPSSTVGDYDLVRKQSNTAGTYKMEILITGKAFCRFSGTGGGISITAGPDLSDNRWHTIVCRKTSSSVRLTVDGASFSKNGNVGSISSSIVLVLGAKPTGGDWYKGLMDEVTIAFG
ncbi:MAG: LamG-like jellyroll fold domain-containing protein [Actinomycetota bacterium]